MPKSASKVAIVIATYNRPNSLVKVLQALQLQTLTPDQIIVVDASPGATHETPEYLAKFKLTYLVASKGSLPAQKNQAIEYLLANWQGDFVQILDDDTQPNPNFLELLASTLESNAELVGVSGFFFSDKPNYVNSVWKRQAGVRRVKQIIFSAFGLDSAQPGIVTRGGIGTFPDPLRGVSYVEWLHGPAMWRRSTFFQQMYNGSLPGSALCEDLDFSTRALSLGKLAAVGAATIDHEMSLDNRPDWPLHYYRFARNRLLIFHPGNQLGLRKVDYVIANIAISLSLFVRGLFVPKERFMITSALNIYRGMADGFMGKNPK